MSFESCSTIVVFTPPVRPTSSSSHNSFLSLNSEPTRVSPMERPEFNSRISSPMTILGSEDESDPVTPHASQNGLLRHPKWSKLKTVSLKVETTLYEVPEQLLSDSLYFGERISDDTDKGTRRIPIVLEDVKVFEMDALLCILDARVVDSEALTNLTYDHWAAILRLATLWRFSVVRSLAIDQISTRYAGRDPLERLELAMNCQVKQWVHPIFVQLCKRSDCLSSQEAERLGVLRFAAITRIREMILRSRIVDAIPTTSSALTIAQVPLAPAGGGLCSGCGGQLHKLWVHKAHDHPLVADTCGGPIIGGASPLAGKAINIAAQVEAAVELRVPF